MSVDLSKLSPAALSVAMRGGTDGWGTRASSVDNVRYSQPIYPRARRRCYCGCNRRATHTGMANGLAMTHACELGIARWVRTGSVETKEQILARMRKLGLISTTPESR